MAGLSWFSMLPRVWLHPSVLYRLDLNLCAGEPTPVALETDKTSLEGEGE